MDPFCGCIFTGESEPALTEEQELQAAIQESLEAMPSAGGGGGGGGGDGTAGDNWEFVVCPPEPEAAD